MAVKARKRQQPYNPAGITTYPSKKKFTGAVNSLAQSQLQPTLNDISARRREEQGAHTTRAADITGYYNFDLAARQAAQDRLQSAMTGILNRNDVLGAGGSEGLAAALRTSAAPNQAAASQLGVISGNTDPSITSALSAYGKADSMGLAGDAAGALTRGAADLSVAGAAGRTAGLNEDATNKANLDALTKERTAAMGTLPGLRTQANQTLLQQILANSQNKLAWQQFGETTTNNRAARSIARQQQGLAEQQFGETKTQNRAGNRLNRAQLREQTREAKAQEKTARVNSRLDRSKLRQQRQQILADQGAAQAKQFDSAVAWLDGVVTPGDQDYKLNQDGKKVFDPKAYNNRVMTQMGFNGVLQQLQARFGMDSLQAYQILATSNIPLWRKKAAAFSTGYQAGLGFATNPAYSGQGRPR
jgi:hypothetical protein